VWCEVIFQFMGSVSITISGIEVRFVGGVVGVCGEIVQKLFAVRNSAIVRAVFHRW